MLEALMTWIRDAPKLYDLDNNISMAWIIDIPDSYRMQITLILIAVKVLVLIYLRYFFHLRNSREKTFIGVLLVLLAIGNVLVNFELLFGDTKTFIRDIIFAFMAGLTVAYLTERFIKGRIRKQELKDKFAKGQEAYYDGDYQKAFRIWKELALLAGHAEAQYMLGKIYENASGGIFNKKDLIKKYGKDALREWCGNTRYDKIHKLKNEDYLNAILKEAKIWYGYSAHQGHAGAQLRLAKIILREQKNKNHEENNISEYKNVYKWLKKSVKWSWVAEAKLSKRDFLDACYHIGLMHEKIQMGWIEFIKVSIESIGKFIRAFFVGLLMLIPCAFIFLGSFAKSIVMIFIKFIAWVKLICFQWFRLSLHKNRAFHWYKKAGDEAHVKAVVKLVDIYKEKRNLKGRIKWEKRKDGEIILESPDLAMLVKSDKETFNWISEIADKREGFAEAQFRLGLMYYNGYGVSQNTRKAFNYYKKAAEQGQIDAQWALARMYEIGRSVKQNHSKASEWYEKAAKQGDAGAQCALGLMYEYNKGVEKNDTKAVEWYRKAAKQGDVHGQYNLGDMYELGKGVGLSNKKAAYWYCKAAEQGYSDAQFSLGIMYDRGQGIEKSDSEALKWYRKAAEQGHEEAISVLNKKVFNLDEEGKASLTLEEYLKMAEQGDKEAQFSIGLTYRQGKGVKQSDSKALKWYKKAAEQEHVSAQFALGVMYNTGQGVGQSDSEAFKWFERAAKQEYVKAQFNLGVKYEKGEGVEQSDKKAFDWYKKAAEQGNAEAFNACKRIAVEGDAEEKYNIGKLYESPMFRGINEAEEWYKKAIEQGHAGAAWDMALLLISEGKEKAPEYYKKAKELYLKEAKKGDAEAQYSLGLVYYHGIYYGLGDKKSQICAYMWFFIANSNGNKDAAEYLEAVKLGENPGTGENNEEDKMSKKEIKKAEELAKRCIESNYEDCPE